MSCGIRISVYSFSHPWKLDHITLNLYHIPLYGRYLHLKVNLVNFYSEDSNNTSALYH